MTQSARNAGIGCFGFLFIFWLAGLTAAEWAVLSWMDPDWLDRVAFWRPPLLDSGGAGQAVPPAGVNDPFTGTWSGRIRLLDGSLSGLNLNLTDDKERELNKQIAEEEERLKQEIDKLDPQRDAAEVARLREQLDQVHQAKGQVQEKLQQVKQAIKAALVAAEVVVRIGVPVEFEIRRAGDAYSFVLTKAYFAQQDKQPELPLVLTATGGLQFRDDNALEQMAIAMSGQQLPQGSVLPVVAASPLTLTLHRRDEIRDEFVLVGIRDKPGVRCKLKWIFHRAAKTR